MENVNEFDKKNRDAQIKLVILRVIAYIFLILTTLICLFFLYVLFVNSTKSNAELQGVFVPIPSSHFFDNIAAIKEAPVARVDVFLGIYNSLIVAFFSSILTTYFSALTAYAIYAYRFKGRKFVATFILAIMMIPSQVSSAGFFRMLFDLQLLNQLWVLIIPSIAAPATYFYMLQYLKSTLPLELVEASRIDGTSEFGTFNRIVLPIMKPAIAVQFIFSFVGSWNNFYIPSLVLKKDEVRTLPVMISALRSYIQSNPAQESANQMWMVILLSILPVLIVYLFLSKSIIKGVTSGSVKG